MGVVISFTRIAVSILEDEKRQCPKCKKYRAREDLGEKLVGIFMKNAYIQPRGGQDFSIFPHGKFIAYYQCRYCKHQWEQTRVVRV